MGVPPPGRLSSAKPPNRRLHHISRRHRSAANLLARSEALAAGAVATDADKVMAARPAVSKSDTHMMTMTGSDLLGSGVGG
jgi:hypothetical protein